MNPLSTFKAKRIIGFVKLENHQVQLKVIDNLKDEVIYVEDLK